MEPQEIHFDNVVYSYPDSDEPAIKGIDLHLRRGEMVALVGPFRRPARPRSPT